MSELDKHINNKLEPIMSEIDEVAGNNIENAKLLAREYMFRLLDKYGDIKEIEKLQTPQNLN